MIIKINIKHLLIVLLIILNLVALGNVIYSDDKDLFIISNDKNWIKLERCLLSNKIFEYPPSLYFKFKSNGDVYTIYYYYTTKDITRKLYKGFWKINYKEKSIYIKLKDADGDDLISEKYFSFKIFYDKKIKKDLFYLIVLCKKKIFVEPEDYERNAYYGSDNYLVLSVAQGIPEIEEDKEFLNKL